MPATSTSGAKAPVNSARLMPGLKPRPTSRQIAGYLTQGLLVASIVCASLGATDQQARFEKVGGHLMCTCGCAQSLLGCDHVGCPNRGDEMEKLRQGIAGGQSDAAILDSFVAEYGAVVLSAPTTKGIDLLAWIMPFAVSALALVGTIFLVRHWAKSQPKLAPAGPVNAKAEDEMRERIRRETGTE